MKRLLSVLLAVCMIFSMIAIVPVTASAETTDKITVFFTDALNWGSANVYYWDNGPAWPGTAMDKDIVNDYGQQVYKAEVPADAKGIIFTANGNQTVDITEGIEDGAAWYTIDEKEGKNYKVEKVVKPTDETTVPETTVPETTETEPETTESVDNSGFYISGTVSGWSPKAEFKLTKNEAAETDEYVFEGLELTTDDQFKVAYSADGVSFKDTDWYPDGMGNNYGENGEITADGTYTVYFRPNVDGGDDWFYGCIYVATKDVPTDAPETTEPETEPETTEPETTEPETTEPETQPETTAPETEPETTPILGQAGFYIAGTVSNWTANPEFKLTKNDAADTEEYVFEGLTLTTEDQFKIAYSADGVRFEDTDWYPDGMGNNYGENGEITADGTYTVYFRPNVDGGDDWFYGCIYLAAPAPETEPETQPETEPETEPETTAPETGAFYIVGNFTEWTPNDAYKMTKNDAADTEEYVFEGLDLTTESQFKVVYVEGETQTWIPDGMGNNYGENGEITADGTYTVYFRPNADGGDDWFYNCIYLAAPAPETEPETQPETEPETTAPETGAYYIVGNFTEWTPNDAYKMTKNDAADTEEYVFEGLDLTTESQFKVVYVEGETQTWIPDGMGNNYGENGEITADGTYTVYFRPNADGGDDWFYNCIYVAGMEPGTEPATTEPGTEPATEAGEKAIANLPNVDEAVAEAGITDTFTVYFQMPDGSIKFDGADGTVGTWENDYNELDGVNYAGIYWWQGAKPLDPWPGAKMTLVDAEQNIFSANVPFEEDVLTTIIFNNAIDGGTDKTADVYSAAHQTANINCQGYDEDESDTMPEGTPEANFDGCIFILDSDTYSVNKFSGKDTIDGDWYFYYGDGHYGKYAQDSENFVSVEDNCCNPNHDHGHQPETTATEATQPETTAPAAGDYYIVGNFTEWTPNDAYKMTKNDAADTDEYVFEGLDLTTESQFKVVYVEGDTQTWIPDGMGNNYGENGEITADGTYTVYFRPNADGGDDWFYNCIYVAEPAPETEPETQPETTAPETGAFYIVGNFTEWTPNDAYKMTKNDAADTEEYVFEGLALTTESQFKVVYVEGETQTWIPDGMGNNYGENGEITADGTYTVYFRPNADGGDDWFYNCIYVAQPAPETEPETQPETEPAPETGAFYIVGNFTEWTPNDAYKMTKNEAADTEEYVFEGLDLTTESQFKVVYVEGETQTWIPDGMGNNYGENGEITADGTYTVYFRPNADGGDDWFYNCIYVAEPAPETEPETQPETEPAPETGAFYIVGNFTEWTPNDAYKMTKNDAADTEEYVFEGLDLTTESQFKVVYVEGETQTWIPDGMGNNYGENGEITADGTYTVYFRPNADGGDDWFYNCIYVAEPAPETEPETQPETEPAPETGAFYIVGNFTEWTPNDAYKMTKNEAAETEEYVFEGLALTTESQFKVVYVEGETQTWIPDGMGNNYGENGEITADGTYTVYFRPNADGGDDWFYGCIYLAAPAPETEPETQPETQPETTAPETGAFYIVGNFTEWTPNDAYKMTKNEAAETEEYVFEGLALTTESQFKVVYVEGETQTWIPDGMGNNYGENGEITADGTYTVYFRPNADGGEDWFYNCIYVAGMEPGTEPATTEPGTEPATEAGEKAIAKLPNVDEAVAEAGITDTFTVYFQMPDGSIKFDGADGTVGTWENDYNELDGVNYAGIYWWQGAKPLDPWPGAKMTVVDAEQNIFSANVPFEEDVLTTIIFNNAIDGGTDKTADVYSAAHQTANINCQGYDEDESDTMPEGTPEANFDGCIFILDSDTYSVNKFSGKDTIDGDWYFYYGDGHYGKYAQDSENFVSVEDNCCNPNHDHGHQPETTATEATQPETTAPAAGDYYIVGNFTEWTPNDAYKMTKNDAADTDEYVFEGLDLTTESQFKVVYVEGDTQTWIPDGMGNNYGENGEITADGTYTVYFRPNADGGDDWFYNCIYVAEPAPETEPETQPETTAPETGAFYIVGNFTEWTPNDAYKMTKNDAADTEEYVFEGLALTTESQFKVVYVEGETQTWIPDGMGNNYGENGEITADGTYTVYFRPNADGGDDWFYNCIYVAEPAPETEPETQPETQPETTPVEEGGYYIAGTMNGWTPNAEYKLTQNALGWYQLNGLKLTTADQFKVAYSADGVSFKDTDWYPDGMGNNYGENGEITVDGSYTVFFDPTVSGGSDWFYGCIFIDMPDPADMFLLGDADGSGDVDAVDATVIQRAATKVKLPYDQKTLMQGDVDDDGELTVIDATFVLRYTSLAPTPYRIGEYVSR